MYELERRGNRFFDDLVRLANLLRLRDKDVVENRFRIEVVADAPPRIEEEVQALIDWMVRQNLGMWQRAEAMLETRSDALRGHSSGRWPWRKAKSNMNLRREIGRNGARVVVAAESSAHGETAQLPVMRRECGDPVH